MNVFPRRATTRATSLLVKSKRGTASYGRSKTQGNLRTVVILDVNSGLGGLDHPF